MTDKVKAIPRRVLQAIYSSPWAIADEWHAAADDIISSGDGSGWLETIAAIARREPRESIEALEARLGRPLANTHDVSIRENGVAVIPVHGVIFPYADSFGMISGGVSVDTLARDFTTAMDNPAVKALVFDFDTPGGNLDGVSEFADMVDARSHEKPVAGYVGKKAASAGYFIAASMYPIVADPTAALGGIGVIARASIRKSAKDEEIIEVVSSQSPQKNLDPRSTEGQSELQAMVDELAQHMIERIAKFRGLSAEKVLSDFGRGKVKLGKSAVASGMADQIGSLESLIAHLGRPRVAAAQTNKSFRGGIMSKGNTPAPVDDNVTATADTPDVAALQIQVEELKKIANDAKAAAVAAESERMTVEGNAQVDAWQREGFISGNATAEVRAYYLGLDKTARPAFAKVMAALPKFDTSRVAVNLAPKVEAHGATLDDFTKIGVDKEASARLYDALSELR